MESGFLQNGENFIEIGFASFYPCFNGIRVLTYLKVLFIFNLFYVSILVLMESGFLRYEFFSNNKGKICFYPCFNGIRVLTKLKR